MPVHHFWMDREGRKDKCQNKKQVGESITCITKTSTLQQKLKTIHFSHAWGRGEMHAEFSWGTSRKETTWKT